MVRPTGAMSPERERIVVKGSVRLRVAVGALAGLGLGAAGVLLLPPLVVPGAKEIEERASDLPPLSEAVVALPPEGRAPAAEPPGPGFDTIRVEPDGSGLVAGRADPGTAIEILADEEVVANAEADADGRFVAFLSLAPSAVPRALSLRDGTGRLSQETVILAPTSAPAVASADGALVEDGAADMAALQTTDPPEPGVPTLPDVPADNAAADRADPPALTDASEVVAVDPGPALRDTAGGDLAEVSSRQTTDPDPAIGRTGVSSAEEPGPAVASASLSDAAAPGVGPPTGTDVRDPGPALAEPLLAPAEDPGTTAVADLGDADLPPSDSPATPPPDSSSTPSANPVGAAPHSTAAVPQPSAPAVEENRADLGPAGEPRRPPTPGGGQVTNLALRDPAPAGTVDPMPQAAPEPEVAVVAPPLPAPDAPAGSGQAPVLVSDANGVRVLQPALPPGADPEVLSTVALDAITYGGTGEVILSGRGNGGAVRLYLDNRPVGEVAIGEDGSWSTELAEAEAGVYTLRLDQLDESGEVVSRIETPFQREERSSLAAAMAEAQEAGQTIAMRTVQPGNTLWAIARDRYGEPLMYVQVFEANRDRIRDPDLIYPGQVFVLPATDGR